MRPVTREGAKILNDLDGIRRRLKNWLAKVEDIEMDSRALDKMNSTYFLRDLLQHELHRGSFFVVC